MSLLMVGQHVLGIDEDVLWTVLIVGMLIVVVLGWIRYAGYLDNDDADD